MRAKNILFVSAIDLWGNDDRPLRAPGKTIEYYINRGYDITIVGISHNNKKYNRYKNVKAVTTFAFLDTKSNSLMRFFLLNFILPFVLGFCAVIKCRSQRFDIIYGYEVHGAISSYCAAAISKIPLVLRFQGTVLDNAHRATSLFLKPVYFMHYLAFSLPCYRAIITDDGTRADKVFSKLNNSKFLFLKNGVNAPAEVKTHEEVKSKLGMSPSDKYICVASRLVRWKKVDRAIEAFKTLNLENVFLVVVGDGPDRSRLEKLASDIMPQVKFIGHVNQEMAYNVIAKSDVFMSFYDLSNVGNPLIEALHAGVPIITLANGDTASVIKDGVNGVLLPEWNARQASDNIIKIITNDDYSGQLRDGAREFSSENIVTWDERLKKEESFLNL